MTLVAAAGLGLVTGLHAASWGAYKDSPFEGFRWRSFLRSVVLGMVVTAVVSRHHELADAVVLLVGVAYAVERLATEWWKAILRDDDQSAYTIPMRLAYRGRVVQSVHVRYVVGAAVVAALVGGCALATSVQDQIALPRWALVIVGGVGGWLTAFGGAWKDAPVEGFSGWKFLRSPFVATTWAVPLSLLTSDPVILAVSAAGFAAASIETYKTFLTGGRPPGKFATKPLLGVRPRGRSVLAKAHAVTWAVLAAVLIASMPAPTVLLQDASPTMQLSHVATAAFAATAATLVLAVGRTPTRGLRTPVGHRTDATQVVATRTRGRAPIDGHR
jgi:hypothetical protein